MARPEDISSPPHPRETTVLFGHRHAEQSLLESYRSGRVSHAWLIGGPPGIGKATLSYRAARFVLAYPDANAPEVQTAETLAVPADHPVARRLAAQAHPDLLVLDRTMSEDGQRRSVIPVDQVRRTTGFFGSTAGEGGWRVCIVDSADDLNAAGANALLKVLEEPPPRSLFFLISHAPGRLLPTIRSRCRLLMLRPLLAEEVARATAAALGLAADDPLVRRAAEAADGSVSRAMALAGGPLLAIRDQVTGLLDLLPATDGQALHAVADSLERAGDDAFATFIETVCNWLSAQLDRTSDKERLAQVGQTWEHVNRAAREVEIFNLERKPFVFTVFSLLAEASRR